MIEGILSLLGAASDGVGLFSSITSLIRGSQTRDHLKRIEASLDGISLRVEQLADRILYVTNMPAVLDIGKTQQQSVADLHKARRLLEAVQLSLDDDLLASSIIATPQKLAHAMANDAFELLMDTRPLHRATSHPNMVPIMFHDRGQPYLGWQSRSGLENMFDVQCDPRWLPAQSDDHLGRGFTSYPPLNQSCPSDRNTEADDPVWNTLVRLIARRIHKPQAHISPNSHLANTLAFDDVDAAELVMDLEDELDISIPDSCPLICPGRKPNLTVGQVYRYLRQR